MGFIHSKPEVEYYTDSYNIAETFSNHVEWKETVKQLNRIRRSTSYDRVNVPDRFGNQPYVIYAIYDNDTKHSIQNAAHDQPHVSICNCIFVFCARTNFRLLTEFPVTDSRRSYFSRLWDSYKPDPLDWSTRQIYMALGFVIAACSEESIPCYPVDAFQPNTISSLLDLPSHLSPVALLTIGAPD